MGRYTYPEKIKIPLSTYDNCADSKNTAVKECLGQIGEQKSGKKRKYEGKLKKGKTMTKKLTFSCFF